MSKIELFVKGHRGLLRHIEASCRGVADIIWVHAASYGEFEEARPIINGIKKEYPEIKVLATFFSPSGYEHFKNDSIADFVFYLPVATPRNARRFLDAVRPVRVIISISDYWLSFLHELRKRKIRTYLTSARFEDGMFYFKPLGRPYLNAFRTCFTRIIVRDAKSLEVLERHGVNNTMPSGDPRMDRVMELAGTEWNDPAIDAWTGGAKVFVAGSILPDEDETVICNLVNSHPDDKFLIIPHETNRENVNRLVRRIHSKVSIYTGAIDNNDKVLIINTVGLLSKLYRYGFAAYVGAGFDGAPHSIIEAAAYGIPVSYGPQFGSHYHCQYMIDCGGGFAIHDAEELCGLYDRLKADPSFLEASGNAARQYCVDGSGVTDIIVKTIMD